MKILTLDDFDNLKTNYTNYLYPQQNKIISQGTIVINWQDSLFCIIIIIIIWYVKTFFCKFRSWDFVEKRSIWLLLIFKWDKFWRA